MASFSPGSFRDRGTFEKFKESLDPSWIEAALEATGTASIRRRRLPAEQALLLVLGMALFRDMPITGVVDHLQLVLPGSGSGKIAPSAVMQARRRLGEEPLRWLFERSASGLSRAHARCNGAALHSSGSTPRQSGCRTLRKTARRSAIKRDAMVTSVATR